MIFKHNMLLEEDENTDTIDRLTTLTSTSYFKRKKEKNPPKTITNPIWINHTPLFKSPKPVPWGETFLQRYTEPPGAWGAASGGFRFLQGASDLCLPAVLRRRLRRGAGWTCCWSADSPIHLSSKDETRTTVRKRNTFSTKNIQRRMKEDPNKVPVPCLLAQHHVRGMKFNEFNFT